MMEDIIDGSLCCDVERDIGKRRGTMWW